MPRTLHRPATRWMPVSTAPWTPASLSNLDGWWDASDLATITSSAGLVSQWNDKSGNAHHMVPPTGGHQPTTGAVTVNGNNVLSTWNTAAMQFGINGVLWQSLNVGSFLAVVKPVGMVGGERFLSMVAGGLTDYNHDGMGIPILGGASSTMGAFYNGAATSSGSMSTNAVHAIANVRNGATWNTYIDGVTGTPATTNTLNWVVDNGAIGIFSGNNPAVQYAYLPAGALVCEMVITASVLTPAERDSWFAYAVEKWGAGWTPANMTNKIAWFDAADASSITSSAGAVSQWNDKSGNGYHVTQGTGANQPGTGTRTIGGKNCLLFAGTTSLANTVIPTTAQPISVYAVVLTDSPQSFSGYVDAYDGSHGDRVAIYMDTSNWIINGVDTGHSKSNTGTPLSQVSVFNSAASAFYENGTQYGGTLSLGGGGVYDLLVGALSGSSSYLGIIGELVVQNAAASASDRAKWAAYVLSKWGF